MGPTADDKPEERATRAISKGNSEKEGGVAVTVRKLGARA
jgi:hypothetical protein